METRAPFALIGAFVLVAMLAIFGFVYWIANTGGIGARTVYAVRFNEPIGGVTPGASVLFNGVRVGAVSAIKLGQIAIEAGWPQEAYAVVPSTTKDAAPLVPALQSYWLWLHVSVTLLGEAFFAIAFVTSIMFLLAQSRETKGGAAGTGLSATNGGGVPGD